MPQLLSVTQFPGNSVEARHDWDRFVEQSINGTFMHTRRFLSYHPQAHFDDHSLWMHDDRARLRAVLPAAIVQHDGERILQSHPGATYGGIVVDDGISDRSTDQIVSLMVQHAEAIGCTGIWMRLPERVYHHRCCEELDVALFRAGFQIEGRELSCAVPLNGPRSNLEQLFDSAARRALRRAASCNVTVATSTRFSEFWEILRRVLNDRYGTTPTHSLEDILRVKELLGSR